jgi:hypothetical protein
MGKKEKEWRSPSREGNPVNGRRLMGESRGRSAAGEAGGLFGADGYCKRAGRKKAFRLARRNGLGAEGRRERAATASSRRGLAVCGRVLNRKKRAFDGRNAQPLRSDRGARRRAKSFLGGRLDNARSESLFKTALSGVGSAGRQTFRGGCRAIGAHAPSGAL